MLENVMLLEKQGLCQKMHCPVEMVGTKEESSNYVHHSLKNEGWLNFIFILMWENL